METLLALIQQYGLAFVFVNVLLLQAGLPVPAYPTLIITGALVSIIPLIALFLTMQRYWRTDLSSGAVKH